MLSNNQLLLHPPVQPGYNPQVVSSQAEWHMSMTPVCEKVKQDNHEFEASLGNTVSSRWGWVRVRICLKQQQQNVSERCQMLAGG